MPATRGEAFHAEVSSTDASGGIAITLYKAGSTTAYTLLSTEYVDVTDIIFISTAGGVYALTMDVNSAGHWIAKGNAAALGGLAHHFETPVSCPIGITPKLFAAAGQVDLIVTGYITKT